MSNLLPHGPFGDVPSNMQGSGLGPSGSGGACSPYRPAAASSQMVPSPDPPASFRQGPATLQVPQQAQQADCWPASCSLDTLQRGVPQLPPSLAPHLPQLPPFCLPLPAGLGGSSGEGAGPSDGQYGPAAAEQQQQQQQQPYSINCFDMELEFSLDISGGSTSNESSPATMIGLHALMDEVQEHGDALTSTLMVANDIFKPLPLQGTSEAERERLAKEAARALRMLHGDSITPSPECTPLVPLHLSLAPPPPVLAAPAQQPQQPAVVAVAPQQALPAPQQPGSWHRQVQVPPQLQVQPLAQRPADAAAAAEPLPLERKGSSAFTCAPHNVRAKSSSSGGSDGSSGDCGQVSSSGSECSGACETSGACSTGGVTALLALCCIANHPEGQSVQVKQEPVVHQPQEQQQRKPQPRPRPWPPRARQQAQRAQQQAQQQQRATRKPCKPSKPGSGSGSKSPAAKLGVKRGQVRKPVSTPASSPAPAKRFKAAQAAARASPGPARKAAAKLAAKAAAGGQGSGKPEPKHALSIDLLEAEGCFDMQQDKAAAHMGFGKTWFKEAIKKIGIERWPYRQLSTLKQSVLLPLEEAIAQHGRLCSPRRASELLAAVRAEYAAVRDKAMRASAPEEAPSGQESKKDELLSDAMRGLRQDIAYKPRNEAKRAACEGASIPEEKLEREVQRVVHKWHAKLCQA